MVLEYFLGIEVKKPLPIFLFGILVSSISISLSAALFDTSSGLAVVAFMTIPSIYLFINILKKKTEEELKVETLVDAFLVNSDIAEMYLFLFLGMMTGVALWFSVLPYELSQKIFFEQINNLKQISRIVTTSAFSGNIFWVIAVNNIKLVILCIILSFILGSGALLILSWNATIAGVAIGFIILRMKEGVSSLAMALLKGFSIATAYYILHLIPEIVAYFYASIAGALISVAVMKYKPFTEKSKKLLLVSAMLLAISIILIFLAALVEVNISHLIQMKLEV